MQHAMMLVISCATLPGHKEAVRATIVSNAARALRRGGLEGVSIPAMMKASGLTHGGFYVHFQNRDDLVAAAVVAAAEETGANVLERTPGDVQAMLEGYLSQRHVDHPEGGCVVAALGTEAARQAPPVQRAFAHAARGLIRLVDQQIHPQKPAEAASDEALVLAAQMVGAVVLARLVDDPDLSSRLLQAVRDHH